MKWNLNNLNSSIYNPDQNKIVESLDKLKISFPTNPVDQNFIWNGVGYELTKVI